MSNGIQHRKWKHLKPVQASNISRYVFKTKTKQECYQEAKHFLTSAWSLTFIRIDPNVGTAEYIIEGQLILDFLPIPKKTIDFDSIATSWFVIN